METIVKRIAIVATAGMFLVLVMGATVTNTGSGEGCGRHWPLCHGEFIPAYALDTAIEYSHRFVTAIEGLLIAATAAGALWLRRDRATRVLVALMVGSLLLQAGMGASAVMYPQDSAILAIHFGISLVCLGSTFLVARVLHEPTSPVAGRRSLDGRTSAQSSVLGLQSSSVPTGYRRLAWGTLGFTLVVAYLGAYLRHGHYELACHRWPSCDGALVPDFGPGVAWSLAHRLAALVAVALVGWLLVWSRRLAATHPALQRPSQAAGLVIVGQVLMGAAVVISRLDLFATLGHAALMALLFVALGDICWQIRPRRTGAIERRSVAGSAAVAAR